MRICMYAYVIALPWDTLQSTCIFACMSTYMHVYTYTYLHAYLDVCISTCTCTRMYISTHACTYV